MNGPSVFVTDTGVGAWKAPLAGAPFTVEDARNLAAAAHAGQRDLTGRDYFTAHLIPIASALRAYGDEAVMAGYLHDIVEDTSEWATPITLAHLRAWGVPANVVDAVDAVTRRDNETYKELITRACAHPLGCVVKLADNWHNITSSPGLALLDYNKAESMLRTRYVPARDRLVVARTRFEIEGVLPLVA